MARPVAAIVSFRLGGSDGVAVEAAKWSGALAALGFDVRTVAGEGPVDRLVPGWPWAPPSHRRQPRSKTPLPTPTLVVVENLCSLPLNERAAAVVAGVIKDRPRASCTTTTSPGSASSTPAIPRPPTIPPGSTSR